VRDRAMSSEWKLVKSSCCLVVSPNSNVVLISRWTLNEKEINISQNTKMMQSI
jgi:hypothetical protein